MNSKRQEIYNEVKNIFPEDTGDKRFLYVRKNWIFPNHIDIVIDNSEKLSRKYEGNSEVCYYGALLHDVGLVYKRNSSSPEGHEERSLEFAKNLLEKHHFDADFIEQVLNCIKSTEPEVMPQTINEKIVRTADSYSQFKSIHFFAKGIFSGDIDYFSKWFLKKIDKNFSKIMFEEERNELYPIYQHYKEILQDFSEKAN